jgi:transposase
MKPPLFVRTLTPEERQALEAGRRSRGAFTMRRCQILLASAAGHRPAQIAQQLGCASQTVRNAIRTFNARGVACVQEQSRRPKTAEPLFTAEKPGQLRAILHQSPRHFGQPRSTWTLALAAQVCWAEGVTGHLVSEETIRLALKRLGTTWRRAKHWITSPDPAYARKKSNVTG